MPCPMTRAVSTRHAPNINSKVWPEREHFSFLVAAEPIVVENGQFSWHSESGPSSLSNINLKVRPGSLVAVVGPVGAGKSSLLSALLGEMYKQSGYVNTSVSALLYNKLRIRRGVQLITFEIVGQHSVRTSASVDQEYHSEG